MGTVIGLVEGGIFTSMWKNHFSGFINSKYCFIAGTLVFTEPSLKAIETFRVGDKVYAVDTETGMKTYKEIFDQVFEN